MIPSCTDKFSIYHYGAVKTTFSVPPNIDKFKVTFFFVLSDAKLRPVLSFYISIRKADLWKVNMEIWKYLRPSLSGITSNCALPTCIKGVRWLGLLSPTGKALKSSSGNLLSICRLVHYSNFTAKRENKNPKLFKYMFSNPMHCII